jgi:hypothetical protein
MHQAQQHEPAGDGPGQDLTQALNRRGQLYVWLDRANDLVAQLRAELAATIEERAALHEEVVYWRRRAARREGLDPAETPPQAYVEALRTAQAEPYREITVDVDGTPWVIGLSQHRETGPDPLREMRSWQQNVAVAREVRASLAVHG